MAQDIVKKTSVLAVSDYMVDLEIEKDLGIKTGDTVIFGSLNRKSFKKLMTQRPPNGWLPLIHPPEPEKEEEEVPEDA